MTEVTRVPLQPIARGALPKLWIGIAAVALAGAGIAWAAVPESVRVETVAPGQGLSPTLDDVALVNYKGTLDDGTVFDEGKQAVFPLGETIPGFTKALEQMQRGGKYHVRIPAKLAYGSQAVGKIPANSALNFDIELLDFKSRAEIEQQQRMIQQLQQMQMQQHGQGGDMPPGHTPPRP